MDRRGISGEWATETLVGPDALLVLDEFGLTCPVRDLYKNTRVVLR